jgi:hypothetical protein
LPQPITVSIPPATVENPHPAALATIPEVDLPALRDTVATCQQNAIAVSACVQDRASRDAQLKMADAQIEALKKQTGALETELRGGTFWRRTKRAAKWLGIGAAAGSAAVCASGHCKY